MIVAVISTAGVLGAAYIAKSSLGGGHDNVITQPPATKSDSASSDPPSNQAGTDNAPTKSSGPTTDSARVVAISPSPGTVLQTQGGTSITLKVHYTLSSADHMLLVPTAEYYPQANDCSGPDHHTIATNSPPQIALSGGEGDTDIVLNIPSNPGGGATSSGSISARASFWSGFDSQKRVIVNVAELWNPMTTCFPL